MVQVDRLKWEMETRKLTDTQVAWHLGISEQCFGKKLQTGKFGTQDILLLTELLDLKCPEAIFFA